MFSFLLSKNWLIVASILVFFVCLVCVGSSWARDAHKEEISFPFIGQVVKDGAKVRTDSRVAALSIASLKKGDIVRVVGQAYGWYKIVIPENIQVYVYGKYVELNGRWAVATANKINVRVKPGLQYPVLGQLSEGQKLMLCPDGGKRSDGWVCVLSNDLSLYGWMHKSLVKFYTAGENVSSNFSRRTSKGDNKGSVNKLEISIKRMMVVDGEDSVEHDVSMGDGGNNLKGGKTESNSGSAVVESPLDNKGNEEDKKDLPIAKGKIEDVGRIFGIKFSYKLVDEKGKIEYYLKSEGDMSKFSGDWVDVYGDVCGVSGRNVPVLCVKKIVPIRRR